MLLHALLLTQTLSEAFTLFFTEPKQKSPFSVHVFGVC